MFQRDNLKIFSRTMNTETPQSTPAKISSVTSLRMKVQILSSHSPHCGAWRTWQGRGVRRWTDALRDQRWHWGVRESGSTASTTDSLREGGIPGCGVWAGIKGSLSKGVKRTSGTERTTTRGSAYYDVHKVDCDNWYHKLYIAGVACLPISF